MPNLTIKNVYFSIGNINLLIFNAWSLVIYRRINLKRKFKNIYFLQKHVNHQYTKLYILIIKLKIILLKTGHIICFRLSLNQVWWVFLMFPHTLKKHLLIIVKDYWLQDFFKGLKYYIYLNKYLINLSYFMKP